MASTFVLAQLDAAGDPAINLKKAQDAVHEAVRLYQPDLMVFPEVYMSHFPVGTPREILLSAGQPLDGPFVTGMRDLARETGVWLVFGMNESVDDPADDRNYNTTVMVDAAGDIRGVYRKTHLYDAFGFQESNNIKPGDALFTPVETPFGKIGMFVCYEVRFPEIARAQAMQGADIILMPTAWMRGDLKSQHFRTLISARAIENTVFMLACDQVGRDCIGESVAVDPMGVTLSCGGETETLVPCRIDLDRIEAVRRKLPSCKDRRPALYPQD